MTAFTDAALALAARSVWDLGQDAGAGLTYPDLGPGGKDLTLSGSGYTQGVATGLPGQPGAIDTAGTNAVLRRDVSPLDQVVTDTFTVVGVFNDNATPGAFANPWICASYVGGHTDPFYTFGIFNNAGNQYRVVVDTGIGFSPVDTGVGVIGNGSFHMLALRYDGADIILNLDGVDISTTPRTGNVGDMGSFAFGDIPALGAGFTINAIMAAGAYWNDEALSEGDLADLFAALTETPCVPPTADTDPSISGTAGVGETLTLTQGTYSGDPTIVITDQWFRLCGSDEEAIIGETGLTYEQTDDDVGCSIFVRETADNDCAPNAVTDSNLIGPVPESPPTNITPPVITGVTSVGHELDGSDGTWTGSPTSFSYQWYLDCGGGPVAILGATTNELETDDSMIGCTLIFGVIAHNPAGDSAEGFSAAFGPITANVPAARRFYQPPPWRFVVLDLQTFETLSFLDHIATQRSVTFVLNGPAVAIGVVPSDNPEVNIPWPAADDDPFVSEGTRALLGFRREGLTGSDEDGPWVIRYAGMILQLEDVAESDDAFTHYTAYDPWQYLMSRPVCNLDGSLPGEDGISWSETRVDVVALEILRNSIFQSGSVHIDAGNAWGGTTDYAGTIEECAEIDINFAAGTTVGEAWQQLTQLDLIDIVLRPIYDPINRPGYLVELDISTQAGSFQDDAIFAWDKPSHSLTGISRVEDGTQRSNIVKFFAGIGGSGINGRNIGPSTDAASIAKFGTWWRITFWPGQDVAGAVNSLAETQLALAKNGRTTVAISPAPQRSPIPFQEYYLGDRVPVYASRRFRKPIPEGEEIEYQRIYGIPIQIADDQTETITSMLTAVQA